MVTAIVILFILCLATLAVLAWACRITAAIIDELIDELNRIESALAQKGIQAW